MSITFKSFYWTIGTTSFRTAQLNRRTEEQLRLLNGFWAKPEFRAVTWDNSVQRSYYAYMREKGFVEGDASRPDKDAREKTSGLVELGLVNDARRLTSAGRSLLAVADSGDFSPDEGNIFGISRDSYLYFLQLLKATKSVGGKTIRPFVAFLYLMALVTPSDEGRKRLTVNEFTYLLPLCVDKKTTHLVANAVNDARRSGIPVDIDATLLSILMVMDNYREALDLFLSEPSVTEDLFCHVGMNRKSGLNGTVRYDAVYKPIFDAMHELTFHGVSEEAVKALADTLGKLSGRLSRLWKQQIFEIPPGGRLTVPLSRKIRLDGWIKDEHAFRTRFLKMLHLLRAKANLEDYADLIKRYFSLSDRVVFQDAQVELDAIPSVFANRMMDWFEKAAFSGCSLLEDSAPIEAIIHTAIPSKAELVEAATGLTQDQVELQGGVGAVMKAERYKRFSHLLNNRFTKDKLSWLLALIENRDNDATIQESVTDNADIPTIFEYLVALAWYYISGKKGDVLDYMKLSLGADFLPKTHAGGGEADIVWQYDNNPPCYERHVLLIEATLSEKDTQRRMEMEPVSRHLGTYMLKHRVDKGAYCTFISTHLNPNVIADFRGKKAQYYYNPDNTDEFVEGMKIIPLDTYLLREILNSGIEYPDLYDLFERHYQRTETPVGWFENMCQDLQSISNCG